MEKRRIGSLDVSVVGLGCNNFGGRLDAEATARVYNATLDAGINFFDTADVYGGTKSEEFMGRAFGTRRDEIVLATKFGHKVDENRRGASPVYIAQAVEDSLRRLQTDRIDLYQLHTPDVSVPIADTLEALDKLVKAGKVREIGCSNFSVAQLREAEAAAKTGAARFVSVQNEYSLLDRTPEEDGVLAETEKTGIAVLPYFPLANGLLTGKYRKGQALPEGTRIKEGHKDLTDDNLEMVEALIAFSESRGHTILDLAFSWLLTHPTVASVIAGATKAEQVYANANAARWKLTEDELAEIDSILSA
jgi:aryl-alcohol dehydrogenase-like predicted oxidoreductase